jgi:hypothetical protein
MSYLFHCLRFHRIATLSLLMLFVACDQRLPTVSDVAGSYAYRLSTGEYEVLVLFDDFSFRHRVYRDHATLVQGGPTLLDESGKWSLSGDQIDLTMSELFKGDFAVPTARLAKPERIHFSGQVGGLPWVKRTSEGRAAIMRNDDVWYNMYRFEHPTVVEQIRWRYSAG